MDGASDPRHRACSCYRADGEQVQLPAMRSAIRGLRVRAPRLASENTSQHRHESVQRHSIVIGIERFLIPAITEFDRSLEGWMATVLLALKPVFADVVEVEIALKDSVVFHYPVGNGPYIGPQHRGSKLRVIAGSQLI